jgi:Myb-like DNA-binding domain
LNRRGTQRTAKTGNSTALSRLSIYCVLKAIIEIPVHLCKNHFCRWDQVIKKGLARGPWTSEEDAIIKHSIKQGITKWRDIAEKVGNRVGKQCRERWDNHLDPALKKSLWTDEEDESLILLHRGLGNKWTKIAKELHGRSENDVKNHWHSLAFRKKYPQHDTSIKSERESRSLKDYLNLNCTTMFGSISLFISKM